MTTKILSFKSLPQLVLSEGATSPDPSIPGVQVWSTTLNKIVYWNGTIWTVGPTGGGSVVQGSGTVVLDFGTGSNEASVVVGSQTGILSTAKVNLGVNADSTSGNHTASDHKWFLQFCSLTASTPVNATGFTIYARSVHKLVGTWVVQYNWIN